MNEIYQVENLKMVENLYLRKYCDHGIFIVNVRDKEERAKT